MPRRPHPNRVIATHIGAAAAGFLACVFTLNQRGNNTDEQAIRASERARIDQEAIVININKPIQDMLAGNPKLRARAEQAAIHAFADALPDEEPSAESPSP